MSARAPTVARCATRFSTRTTRWRCWTSTSDKATSRPRATSLFPSSRSPAFAPPLSAVSIAMSIGIAVVPLPRSSVYFGHKSPENQPSSYVKCMEYLVEQYTTYLSSTAGLACRCRVPFGDQHVRVDQGDRRGCAECGEELDRVLTRCVCLRRWVLS